MCVITINERERRGNENEYTLIKQGPRYRLPCNTKARPIDSKEVVLVIDRSSEGLTRAQKHDLNEGYSES